MTTAEQYARLGASVENDGEFVIITIGKETIAMTLEQCKRFRVHLACAYQDASYIKRHPVAWTRTLPIVCGPCIEKGAKQ